MDKHTPHILILSSWYPNQKHPFLGNFVERQARLLKSCYNVTVLVTESRDADETEIRDTANNGLREVRILHPRGSKLLERRKQLEQALNMGLERIEQVDLIIGHVILPKGLQFVQAKKHFNCPLILVEHGSYFRPAMREKRTWIEKLILRKTRKHLDEVVAVSEFLKKDMEQDFPKHQIKVIGNHIDASLFHFAPKPKHERVEFLHVSTMDERTKNPEGIICACRALKDEVENFRFTIICDEDTERWQHLASNLELNEYLRFVGPLKWEEVASYYYDADAFVLFSDYESFSIVLAEAWATGTPTITTPVGIAANMPSTAGIAVEPGNTRQLIASMRDFAQAEHRESDNRKIAEYGAQFSGEVILGKWKTLISKYVEKS